MNIIKLDTCSSTNSFLKALSEQQPLEEAACVLAREQTAGRGQAGNHWESEAGKNLTFSLLFYPNFLPVKEIFLLSEAVSLGVKTVLDHFVDDVTIKWPNDIYVGERKIAGILIENDFTGEYVSRSIAGIGLNVNQAVFRSDAPNPVSLIQLTGRETNLDQLLLQLLDSIFKTCSLLKLQNLNKDFIEQQYNQALYRREGRHLYRDQAGLFHARIELVDSSGYLHLIDDSGLRRSYPFKAVSFVRS
ncbi:MAG: biotin--[acetyl-CoA-carboxylase] ligase [Dysgonamonadaceae bacterium]|jgi:BirA family biotin operon repressor/biotin-[acetyl-CoA-carboxylase] ligase|nr:biotin--[acetyl-CoA-carboxylase] ligase [Dysgonamonadaceae bacterium]